MKNEKTKYLIYENPYQSGDKIYAVTDSEEMAKLFVEENNKKSNNIIYSYKIIKFIE